MMLDLQNLVSDQQDLAQTVAAYLSTYSIDLGAAGTVAKDGTTLYHDAGSGKDIELLCQVTESFVGATATVSVELVMADDAALTSNLVSLTQAPGASITVGIPVATLVAGYNFRVGRTLPLGITKRYLGLRYNIFTATTTAGKITAGIVLDKQTNNKIA